MMNTNDIKKDVKGTKEHEKKVIFKKVRKEHLILFLMLFCMLLSYPHVAYASSGTAEDKWNGIVDFILPWITRFGGVLALWGGVELGSAWKDDDANGKAKGFKFIMAGVIIIAVAISSNIFLS